jgi:hypothetical protein
MTDSALLADVDNLAMLCNKDEHEHKEKHDEEIMPSPRTWNKRVLEQEASIVRNRCALTMLPPARSSHGRRAATVNKATHASACVAASLKLADMGSIAPMPAPAASCPLGTEQREVQYFLAIPKRLMKRASVLGGKGNRNEEK